MCVCVCDADGCSWLYGYSCTHSLARARTLEILDLDSLYGAVGYLVCFVFLCKCFFCFFFFACLLAGNKNLHTYIMDHIQISQMLLLHSNRRLSCGFDHHLWLLSQGKLYSLEMQSVFHIRFRIRKMHQFKTLEFCISFHSATIKYPFTLPKTEDPNGDKTNIEWAFAHAPAHVFQNSFVDVCMRAKITGRS